MALTVYIVNGCCVGYRQKIGSRLVTVALTPNGYADAVHDGMFVTPAERQITVSQFIDIISDKMQTDGVVYIQKQNSNFTEEFSELSDDVDLQMTWATQAFGNLIFWLCYFFTVHFALIDLSKNLRFFFTA